jgi:hypothetical protein
VQLRSSRLTCTACEVHSAICCNGQVICVCYGAAWVNWGVVADVCGKKSDNTGAVVILE